MSYYNTTNLTGSDLNVRREKAETQEEITYKIFQTFGECSPFDVLEHWPEIPCPPITSIRRAITNLTKDGYLFKTNRKVMGEYGAVNYTWRIAEEQLNLFR